MCLKIFCIITLCIIFHTGLISAPVTYVIFIIISFVFGATVSEKKLDILKKTNEQISLYFVQSFLSCWIAPEHRSMRQKKRKNERESKRAETVIKNL